MSASSTNPAAVPECVKDVQGDGRWQSLHQRFLGECMDREPEVLFIGDSIIQQMAFSSVWKSMLEPLHCLNFGIGGDQTQHVLWRITEGGELANIQPKVIVLLVGTNNYDHTAEQVFGGIMKIVEVIGQKQPEVQLIVMGLLPRGEKPNTLRDKFKCINTSLKQQLDGMPNVTFFNLTEKDEFVDSSGAISSVDMYDYLHLTDRGYKTLCEPLAEEIQSLTQTFNKVENTSQDNDSIDGQLAGDS